MPCTSIYRLFIIIVIYKITKIVGTFWLVKNLWFIVAVNSLKAIDHTFYGFTGVITNLGCWENTRKACQSLAEGEWFTSFSSVLPTSQVGYHAGKPMESVVYCFNNCLCVTSPCKNSFNFFRLVIIGIVMLDIQYHSFSRTLTFQQKMTKTCLCNKVP